MYYRLGTDERCCISNGRASCSLTRWQHFVLNMHNVYSNVLASQRCVICPQKFPFPFQKCG